MVPFFKYASDSNDRTWWLKVQTDGGTYKVHQLCGITLTHEFENTDVAMLKFIIGPFCFGFAWRVEGDE